MLGYFEPYAENIYYETDYMRYFNSTWLHYGLSEIGSDKAYKLDMSHDQDKYNYYNEGTLFDPASTIDLYAGQENWIGYWLEDSQDMNAAFGSDFTKVTSMKSEYWYYKPFSSGLRGLGQIQISSSRIRPLHYGNGYIVEVSEDIIGFSWDYQNNNASKDLKQKVENFTYTQDNDYESIDIIGINEDVVEIGAISDGVCIGASVVDEDNEQILIYPDVRSNSPIYFELVYEGRERTQLITDYATYDIDLDNFVSEPIYVNDSDYNLISFNEIVGDLPTKTSLFNNIPNPFNPSTTIHYNIAQQGQVEIRIYNIRGQNIKTLVDNRLEQGSYSTVWNGDDDSGAKVSSGVYLYKLNVNGKTVQSKKCLMLK